MSAEIHRQYRLLWEIAGRSQCDVENRINIAPTLFYLKYLIIK